MELILKNIAIIQSKNTIWIQATQLMAMAVLNKPNYALKRGSRYLLPNTTRTAK